MNTTRKTPFYLIFLLILAAEAVFILPFVLARIFRPTVLDVFEVTNLELGLCFSVYGIVALVSYLFGGPLADTFQPKKLMGIALVLTALGGVYLATYPSYQMLKVLYGYWGFTTIFLFWAAMIKATRAWGGANKQGRAFGFLDGGRGLVAALFGSLGVVIFSFVIPADLAVADLSERKEAFRMVILTSSAIVAAIGVITYFFLKIDTTSVTEKSFTLAVLKNFRTVVKIPSVYLLMIIILCAYVGYKLTDDFSLYASEVMNYNEVDAATLGGSLLYTRPVIGVVIGLLADRYRSSLWIMLSFMIMLLGALLFAFGIIQPGVGLLFIFSLLIIAVGVFAMRTLYFSAIQEGGIPLVVTGTAVGLISVIGYTPDIFVGPAMGYLLDESPGMAGHQHVFIMLAVFAGIGSIAAVFFHRLSKKLNPVTT